MYCNASPGSEGILPSWRAGSPPSLGARASCPRGGLEALLPRGDAVFPRGEAVLPRGDAVFPRGEAVLPRGEAVFPRGEAHTVKSLRSHAAKLTAIGSVTFKSPVRISFSHVPWSCSGREPSANLGLRAFVLRKFALAFRDGIDKPASHLPYVIIRRNQFFNEIFQFSRRSIVRHHPDSNPGPPVYDRAMPLRRLWRGYSLVRIYHYP